MSLTDNLKSVGQRVTDVKDRIEDRRTSGNKKKDLLSQIEIAMDKFESNFIVLRHKKPYVVETHAQDIIAYLCELYDTSYSDSRGDLPSLGDFYDPLNRHKRIDTENIEGYLSRLNMHSSSINEVLSHIDKDGDGVVSKEDADNHYLMLRAYFEPKDK